MISSSEPNKKVLRDWKPLGTPLEVLVIARHPTTCTAKLVRAAFGLEKTSGTYRYVQNNQPAVQNHQLKHHDRGSACAVLCRESKRRADKKKRSRWPSTRPGDFRASAARQGVALDTLTAGAGCVGHRCQVWEALCRKTKSGPVRLRSRAMF